MSGAEISASVESESLHAAARRGDTDVINRLLSNGADVNALDAKGRAALLLAAREGHADVVRHLLKWGADINAVSPGNATALRQSVRAGHAEVVGILLAQNADPEIEAPPRPTTPKQEARSAELMAELAKMSSGFDERLQRFGIQEAVKAKSGPDKKYSLPAPQRLLSLAISSQSAETLRALLEAGFSPNPPEDGIPRGMTPLKFAASVGDVEAGRLLLQYGAKVHGGDDLVGAVMKNRTELAELLLEAGADPNRGDDNDSEGMTPLTAATFYGNVPMIELMGRYGAKPNGDALSLARSKPEILALLHRLQGTHWHEAARGGDLAAVQSALDAGADIDITNEAGETGLIKAIQAKQGEMARYLLNRGASPVLADQFGNTALHYAVSPEDAGLISLLLERGANLAAENKAGLTPLYFAANQQKGGIADLLASHGAAIGLTEAILLGRNEAVEDFLRRADSVEVPNVAGVTPLMAAARRGDVALMETLLARGANVAARDRAGNAPLAHAVAVGNLAAARLLIERGADVAERDENHHSLAYRAAIYARGDESPELLRLLLSHGAPTAAAQPLSAPLTQDAIRFAHIRPETGWEIVRVLIEFIADPNEESFSRATTLGVLLDKDAPLELINLLLQKGADPNGAKADSSPPLLVAAAKGRLDYVQILLDAGADPNGGASAYRNPLFVAEAGNHAEVAALLRARGATEADPTSQEGRFGLTPGFAALLDHKKLEGDPAEMVKRLTDTLGDVREQINQRRRKRQAEED